MKEKRSRSSSAPAGSRESLANSLEDVISSQESIKEALTEWQQKFTKDQLAQLTPQQRKLYSAIWELIMTERDYCRDLAILVNDFMKPMQNMKLDKRNLQLLFCNIEYLLTISTDFLQQLEGLSDLKDLKKCADVFMQTAERFMHYTPFCAMQQTTNKQVQQMLSKPEVKAFLQKPHLRKLDLNGFMLKPVQRICKYPLLIREIIKHASTSHPDYPDLQRALEKIQGAVKAINECSKKLVSYEAIYETQTR
ncbi:Dbl homology domain-containing protein, partial [Gorgonomyces haynaldii]